MGSYSALYLGSFYLGGDKGEINPAVMRLFRESDKVVEELDAEGPAARGYEHLESFADGETFTVVGYLCSVEEVRDRLDVLGFTLELARTAFEMGRRHELELYEDYVAREGGDLFQDDLTVVRELTADDWIAQLREIKVRRLKPTYAADKQCEGYPPLLRYMLCTHGLRWYGYPGFDVRHMIRLAVQACSGDESLFYDLTELIAGGYYNTADELSDHATDLLQEDFVVGTRVVVLTEGSSDKWMLERSLRLLFPHLSDYFSFIDFDGARIAGGAGALANMVKAFVGAGIANRVVALFDNDTAATAAIRTLSHIDLPGNIAVIQYPPLPLAEAYPTIGPTGLEIMNVNGLAGSIELYLGTDVLQEDGETLVPVQWRGYDGTIGQYQGEIQNKARLQDRFHRKLTACEEDSSRIPDYDWQGIRLILERLRSAFHPADAVEILAWERRTAQEP